MSAVPAVSGVVHRIEGWSELAMSVVSVVSGQCIELKVKER